MQNIIPSRRARGRRCLRSPTSHLQFYLELDFARGSTRGSISRVLGTLPVTDNSAKSYIYGTNPIHNLQAGHDVQLACPQTCPRALLVARSLREAEYVLPGRTRTSSRLPREHCRPTEHPSLAEAAFGIPHAIPRSNGFIATSCHATPAWRPSCR